MRPPSLRQIEAFRAVVEVGTVSRAAELLRISQPAVSKLLINLEGDTGLNLFDRGSGRLVLTDRGMRLYEEVDRIFSGVDQLARAVEAARREERGRLEVGVMPALGGKFIAEVVSRFLERHPTVHVRIHTRSSQFLIEWLHTQQLDVGIVTTAPEHPHLAVEQLNEEPFCCILPVGHAKAHHRVLTPESLRNECFVAFLPDSYTRRRIETVLESEGVTLDRLIEATTATTVCELVAAGLGIALVHPLMLERVSEKVIARPFSPTISSGFLICRPQSIRNRELIHAFSQAARDVAQDMLVQLIPK
jgi:DNA-binding transcriptional LysR family regulator